MPSTSSTTQPNGHYANQYPNHNSDKSQPSQLAHNQAYQVYAPNIMIVLSTFYLIAFLLQYIIKRCQRYKDKKQQKEKQQLILAWKRAMTKFELLQSNSESINVLLYPDSAYNNSQKQQHIFHNSSATSSFTLDNSNNHSSPSTNTIVDIDNSNKGKKHYHLYSLSTSTTSSSLYSSATATTTAENSIKIYQQPTAITTKAATEATVVADDNHYASRRSSRHILFGRSNSTLTNYWKINNRKRLNLLWQWSISMGYCEYTHAKQLDAIVRRLEKAPSV